MGDAKKSRRRSLPAASLAPKVAPYESEECIALVQWMDARGLVFCHIPNESKRPPAQAKHLKAMGMQPGFPDYLVFTRPPNEPKRPGVALEMKRSIGGKLRDDQSHWLKRLAEIGWVSLHCAGVDEAIADMSALGY